MEQISPITMVRSGRPIRGMSAILLPFTANGLVDWDGFEGHVERTTAAGLTAAVNMDTGYANLIDEDTRQEALRRTEAIMGGEMFVAGAFVFDQPDSDVAVLQEILVKLESGQGAAL